MNVVAELPQNQLSGMVALRPAIELLESLDAERVVGERAALALLSSGPGSAMDPLLIDPLLTITNTDLDSYLMEVDNIIVKTHVQRTLDVVGGC